MRTAEELAGLLTRGVLSADDFPELADEEVVAEVRERLTGVGHELARAGDYYVARAPAGERPEGFEPIFELDEAELAVAACLYLHLVYLPRHGRPELGGAVRGRPSVAVEDIAHAFPRYTQTKMAMLLGRLRNADFISRVDNRYVAGPYLHAFDAVEADERAHEALRNFRLRRYFQRYAAQELGGDRGAGQRAVDDEGEDEPAPDDPPDGEGKEGGGGAV